MTARSKNPLSIGAAIGSQDLADEQRSLLDLIAKLQYAQLDNVKLPQIVVVGDQSAGKSSVLEAITGTPFPRDAGACTRFATEIRLRRSKEESFSIHIIPDKKHRSLAEQERLRQFGRDADESTGFEALMKHAVEQIAPRGVPGRFASEDILVVEKQGPQMPLLTVVDLPGLVKNANTDQSADDIRAINDLTDSYMKSSRTIILAVVGGNQDYVQAPVLTKAREFDPTGARTIGVLTKPDLTESIGLEDKFIALVNNKDRLNHFELGWYVLLNPGPREPGQKWPSPEERKQREDAFFAIGKWSTLPPEMCGAAALKAKLSLQLQRHIGKHVKALRKDIQKALEECEAELKALGTGKDTVEEMRDEIVELFSDSKDLVIPAVYGMYGMDIGAQSRPFFPQTWNRKGTPPTNLRARAVEENKRFAERVRTHGHRVTFSSISDSQGKKAKKLGNMTKQEFARMEVEPLLQQRAGTGFPMDHEPRLVYVLFQRFSDEWSKLAQEHKDNLGVICNEFLGEVIDHVWPRRMREPLRRKFLDPQIKSMLETAQSEVEKLLQDRNFEVQPYDPEYEDRLIKWRTETSKEGPYTVAEEFLEKTLIYYELSARVFIRNVITQVVERHLLQGLYHIFSSVKANRLSDETVEAIAAENKATRDKRTALKDKKAAIEEARDICASLAMRKELRSFDDDELESDQEDSDDEDVSHNVHPSGTQTPSVRSDIGFNGNHGHGHNVSFDLDAGAQSGIARKPTKGRADQHMPEGRYDPPPVSRHSPTLIAPQHAPPPPPRPEKIRILPGDNVYPPTPPDSRDEKYNAQPDLNSHGYSNAQLDMRAAPVSMDYVQSPARKASKKIFGMQIS